MSHDETRDDAVIVAELVERRPELLAFLERRLGDRALAEDILQDAFARSLDKVSALRDPKAAVAWFYRMLRNAAIDQQRRQKAVTRALDALTAEREREDEQGEAKGEICRCVSSIVATLKPEYEAALRRIEIEGVSVKGYADEAGITSNNAAVRVFRARNALRERVHATCRACAERGCVECTCGEHA